jgi:hypothetical protein
MLDGVTEQRLHRRSATSLLGCWIPNVTGAADSSAELIASDDWKVRTVSLELDARSPWPFDRMCRHRGCGAEDGGGAHDSNRETVLFVSSYAPLLVLFALLQSFGSGYPSYICVGLFAVSVVLLVVV